MLFILFSSCRCAAVSLVRAIIPPMGLKLWVQENPVEICMRKGQEGREQSPGAEERLFLSAAWKGLVSGGLVLHHPFDVEGPHSDLLL